MKPPTISIFHNSAYPNKAGKSKVYIKVTFQRKRICYPTHVALTEKEFFEMNSLRPNRKLKQYKIELLSMQEKAETIIEGMDHFDWDLFDRLYMTNRKAAELVETGYKEYILNLRESDSIGTAVAYECSLRFLLKFKASPRFKDIDIDFLKRYENHMIKRGLSKSTMGIYLRCLRTIMNYAIHQNWITKDLYPFLKYTIPTSTNKKRALGMDILKQIKSFSTDNESILKARDLWLFLYFGNGMNVKDMCLLKYENIKGNKIEYERAKTAKTDRNPKPIEFIISQYSKEVMTKWGQKKINPGTYIFPFLTDSMTADEKYKKIQLLTSFINANMKRIKEELAIPEELPITTYVARHSFVNSAVKMAVSIYDIKNAVGHSNIKITENYLASIDEAALTEIHNAINIA